MILALARDAEVSDAYVREGLGCLNRLRAVCGLDSASLFKLARRRRRAPRHRRAVVPAQPAATRPSSTNSCSGLLRSPRSTTRCCGPCLARHRRDAVTGRSPRRTGGRARGPGAVRRGRRAGRRRSRRTSFDKTSEKGDDDDDDSD